MKYVVPIMSAILLAACASQQSYESTALSTGDVIYTVRCGDNLSACHNDARKICGAGGYEEVDRFVAGDLGNDGRFDDGINAASQGSGIYKEDVRMKVRDQGLSIRCKGKSK